MTVSRPAYRSVACTGSRKAGTAFFRVGDANRHATVMGGVTGFTGATGVLSGTTGVDGDLTVSTHTDDNRVYIENRTGASGSYKVTFMNLTVGHLL